MRIYVLDSDLFFSHKLHQSLTTLGHEVKVFQLLNPLLKSAQDVASDYIFVNLGNPRLSGLEAVKRLGAEGWSNLIGYAGHRERELHWAGREAGCLLTVTNREVIHRIESVLKRAASLREQTGGGVPEQ